MVARYIRVCCFTQYSGGLFLALVHTEQKCYKGSCGYSHIHVQQVPLFSSKDEIFAHILPYKARTTVYYTTRLPCYI